MVMIILRKILKKWGKSYIILLNKEDVKTLNLKEGDIIDFEIKRLGKFNKEKESGDNKENKEDNIKEKKEEKKGEEEKTKEKTEYWRKFTPVPVFRG